MRAYIPGSIVKTVAPFATAHADTQSCKAPNPATASASSTRSSTLLTEADKPHLGVGLYRLTALRT